MASYSGHSSDLDRALDGLGFSYLDGIPFRIDPRIENVSNYDYSRANELLSRPLPAHGLSDMCVSLIDKIGSLEKQVLGQLESLEKEKEARKEKQRIDEEALENKRIAKAVEEAAKKSQEEVEKAAATSNNSDQKTGEELEDDNLENGTVDTSPADTETEPSTASISDVVPRK